MRACVDRFDVGGHLRFDHAVDEARWDEEAERWVVRAAGEEYVAEVLVWATGSLSEPQVPDFPGLDGFRGKVFHSAKWEHGFDLTEQARLRRRHRRVRPSSSCPRSRRPSSTCTCTSGPRRGSCPGATGRSHACASWPTARCPRSSACRGCASTPSSSRCSGSSWASSDRTEGAGAQSARSTTCAKQVPDEALRAKLTPHYEPGCKRLLLSDDYYPSLTLPQRRGRGLAGRLVHRPRGRGPGRHRPPGRRRHHGHRLRGRRASLRRAHRRPRRRPALRAVEGRRRRGVRRLHRGRASRTCSS